MKIFIPFLIHTANILGIFNDPFEFEGDYGSEVNPIRNQVFELVVSKEALAKQLSDATVFDLMAEQNPSAEEIADYRQKIIQQARENDRNFRPTLSSLVTKELIEEIKRCLIKQGYDSFDLERIIDFVARYGDQKVFHFFRNAPSELLSLDKALRDAAAREGRVFNVPILGSPSTLLGHSSFDLKRLLAEAVFTQETLALTKPQTCIEDQLNQLDINALKSFFGHSAKTQDLHVFATPIGQVFFYWMYHALNLHLVSQNPGLIGQINTVKEIFATTLGDQKARAKAFKEKILTSGTSVLFTQESDFLVPKELISEGHFLPIDRQNAQDGTFVLLKREDWEDLYEILEIEGYEGAKKGRLNTILATRKGTGQRILLPINLISNFCIHSRA